MLGLLVLFDMKDFSAIPKPPYFDHEHRTWTLSRYLDVYAALREPALCQFSEHGQTASPEENAESRERLYAAVQGDFSRMNAVEWQVHMDRTMRLLLNREASGNTVDLVRRVIQPWSAAILVGLSRPKNNDIEQVTKITERLFYRQLPAGSGLYRRVLRKWFSIRQKRLDAELDRMMQSQRLPLSRSMFAGLTQTLPSFLAKAWLALLQNPGQMEILRSKPALMPNAVEELLRYAGIVHTISRNAASDVTIGDARIECGQRVILDFTTANRDASKFSDPDRLDVSRQATGHLGLGTGLHACVGAMLVRSAAATVTPIFLATHPVLGQSTDINWTGDRTIHWPIIVPARLTEKVTEEMPSA